MVKASDNLAWAKSVGLDIEHAVENVERFLRPTGKRCLLFEEFDLFKPIESYFVDSVKGLSAPTKPFGYGDNIDYPMACNQDEGDCTIAGIIHVAQIQAQLAKVDYQYVGDSVTHSVYRGLTGGPDTGLQLSQVIEYCSSPNALNFQIAGAASVDISDFELMKTVLYNFGALYLAVALPQSAETEFANHQVWGDISGPSIGGHCIAANGNINVLKAKVSPTTNLLDIVTWADETELDLDFWKTYGVQAIVVIPQWFIECGHDAVANLNKSAMLDDLKNIGNARATLRAQKGLI